MEKDPTEPVRKSLRLAGGKVPEIKRFTFEQFEFLDEQLKSRKIRPEDFYLDDELVSRNIAVEEREKMLEEMAAKWVNHPHCPIHTSTTDFLCQGSNFHREN